MTQAEKSEIVDRYTRKSASITVLSQLNACSTDEIIDVLNNAGVLKEKDEERMKAKEEKAKKLELSANINIKMPDKLISYKKVVLDDIDEEIDIHKQAIRHESEQIQLNMKRIKEIEQQIQHHNDTIVNHKISIQTLQEQSKEVNRFYEQFVQRGENNGILD